MKKRLLAALLAVCMLWCFIPTVSAAEAPTEQEAYQQMIALKEQYPEGTLWDNSNYYGWKGGIYSGGYGCAGFAFMLSDAAFGTLPARLIDTGLSIDTVRVGDILRMNSDTHSVIVLEVYSDYVVIAEGNYNSSVHWGRTLSGSEVASADYLMTRYPAESTTPAPEEPVEPEEPEEPMEPTEPETPAAPTQFKDVPADAYYADAVAWAVENGITSGTSETTFSPNAPCTRAQAVTFLWRAAGSPEVGGSTGFSDVPESAYYADAVKWAVANGITQGTGSGKFSPNATCNRAQIVTFMYRAAGSPAASGNVSFSDVSSGDYYAKAVQWAVANGITQGTSATRFSPDNSCTRAQIVTFLHRASAYEPGYEPEETPDWYGTFVRENGETLVVTNVTDSNVYLTAKLLDAAGDWYEIDRVLTFESGSKTVASVPFRDGEPLLVYYTLKSDRITVDYPEGWWADQDFIRQ